jgi:hypothetical protein
MFNIDSSCDDYVIHVSLFIVNLRIFFLYFLKTQNVHVNLFVNDKKNQIQYLNISKEKNAQSLLDHQLCVTYMNMMLINGMQNNST